jgi:signal transduction histidine kinase
LSLRFKLTLFYALISALILGLGTAVLFVALRQSVYQSFDDALRDAAQLAVSQLGGHDNDPRLEKEGQRFEASQPGATALTVFSQQGQQVDYFGDFKIHVPLEPGFYSVDKIRVFTKALPGGGFIQAARSQLELEKTISRAGQVVLVVLPVLVLIGFAAGYVLADRALRPVDQVSSLAAQIASSGRYQDRVPSAPGNDEMARLTRTVNAMLERLERTIERERAFTLGAAHELRTPLAALIGRTSLTLERTRDDDTYRAALLEADEIARQMTATVDSLLTLARSDQAANHQALDLSELAFDAIQLLEPKAQAHNFNIESTLEPAALHGDPSGLRLAITNLLENAIKYGRVDGHVWIRTGATQLHAWLEITDDGLGISESELERLRQPFQRGLGVQHLPGSGLGLTLVNAVMESHNGRLELSQAEEGGLRGVLEIPIGKLGFSSMAVGETKQI